MVRRAIPTVHMYYFIVFDMERQLAADTTIRADGIYNFLGARLYLTGYLGRRR